MPVYDYLCDRCGPFTLMRPMAESALGASCPDCARSSPRAIMTAPRLSTLSSAQRQANAINERSAHAPRTLAESKAAHGPGCSCCSAKPTSARAQKRNGAKGFPDKRPWMISH
jgi:putative FmdB family regulatory protein